MNVFIADSNNHRVLYFGSPMDYLADAVIGQTSFNSGLPNQGLPNPTNAAFSGRGFLVISVGF